MSKEVKLTQEEVSDIRAVASKETAAITQLGSVVYQLNTMKLQKDLILNSINELSDNRIAMMNKLQEKYGLGSINIDTGEFTPTE